LTTLASRHRAGLLKSRAGGSSSSCRNSGGGYKDSKEGLSRRGGGGGGVGVVKTQTGHLSCCGACFRDLNGKAVAVGFDYIGGGCREVNDSDTNVFVFDAGD